MSLVLRTVQAFPRGRTTEELLVLVGASFSHDKRVSALAELDQLMRDGLVHKGSDGRWRAKQPNAPLAGAKGADSVRSANVTSDGEPITAAAAYFKQHSIPEEILAAEEDDRGQPDPHALLRYWRSALRADPRGATTQVADKHGVEWSLISGRGPIHPDEGKSLLVTIELEALAPSFREALVRREGNENALAIGWPIAVGRTGGVPVFQPVGLYAAAWQRRDGKLILTVDADDVLVNPDWVRAAARPSGWSREALADLFDANDGLGLRSTDFLEKVRTAVASQVRGRIVGADLATGLDPTAQGIYDSAGIFLPTDSSFTAGAARDLDAIANWPEERISRTALGAVLGLKIEAAQVDVAAIDAAPLNREQLRAVSGACTSPITVVTGPPGTGKSQAIVSMAASVLAAGGSVLVASKNHQALDAVEDRLGSLAPQAPFIVRTLNPDAETDTGFSDALKKLIENENTVRAASVDEHLHAKLNEVAKTRSKTVHDLDRLAEIECQIASVLERIEAREKHGDQLPPRRVAPEASLGWFRKFLAALKGLFIRRGAEQGPLVVEYPVPSGKSLAALGEELARLRAERERFGTSRDPLELGATVQELTAALLPKILAARAHLSEERRQEIAELFDDWQFAGGRGHPPTDLSRALIQRRPLWLASILGTPKRIPLDDSLFDLVVFDEASQCDIATAIPLFARAKRAVVVGDDRQLSFIAQLGLAQDRNLMQAQGLPVKNMGRFSQSRRSLFDFASRIPSAERVTLRHQYRSAGPIVEYISENFYGGQLATSYDPNRLIVPSGMKPGLAWQHVPAPGVPQSGNLNPNEVNAIVRHLKMLLLDGSYTGSVGVITPFRAQVSELERAIKSAISETRLLGSEFKVGTVDGFQGQERDLILFSPCVGPRSPQSGLTFFQRDARRLNVAISRARAVAMIFGDLEFARSGQSKSLQRLAAKATEPAATLGEGVFDVFLRRGPPDGP